MGSGRRQGWGILLIGMVAMIGCKPDLSEKLLKECEAMQAAGEVGKAWDACSAAVRLNPTSKAAEVASAKLRDLGPVHEKLEKERVEVRAKAAEAEKAAQAARLEALRKKVQVEWYGFEPDGECTGKGLPPYRKNYSGGTYDEDEVVALADGCVHLFQRRNNMNDSTFCCPREKVDR